MRVSTKQKSIFNLLKNIRDQDTAYKKQGMSYKIDEHRLKRLRQELKTAGGVARWQNFCKKYVGNLLLNEWNLFEEDLDLRFVEILEGQISELFEQPLTWTDMVTLMGTHGIRGPDAMIINLFSKSKFPLLITNDSDFEHCFDDPLQISTEKAVIK